MNLLYFGDFHIDKYPASRIDDYRKTQENKINEIKQIAKDNNALAFLEGGDFLNKDILSSEQLSRILELWQGVNTNELITDITLGNKPISELIKVINNNAVMPMFGVAGNHELTGNDISSLEKTSLSLLTKSGFMTFATKENPIIIKDESGFTVAITGSHYSSEIDDDDKSAYIVDEKLGDYHIHIVHGMLMDKSYGKKFKHTTLSEIAYKTKADLTINGHDHIGYGLTEIDGKQFINPGSPLRLSANKNEMARMPKVLILKIDNKTGIKIEEHYLKSAEIATNVLSRDHIEKSVAMNEKLIEIEDALNKAHLGKGIDITDIINKMVINEKLDPVIGDKSILLITDKMRELDTPFNPSGEYIIENIKLENFLCHKNTYLDFTDGLNVLYGESRSGKSAVLRAIREVAECYLKNPRDFIFHNEDYFKITLTLSNGYVISRIVERKKTGKNGYEIYDPNTGELTYSNTKSIDMVQEILGLNKIKLTERNKVGINFLNQGESWFFIGNNLSAPDKAKLTGVVYGTHYADGVLKDINSTIKKVNTEITFYEKDIKKLEDEKLKYLYINEYEKALAEAERQLIELEKKEDVLNKIKEIELSFNLIENEGKLLSKIIKKISEKEIFYKESYEELLVMTNDYTKLNEVNNQLISIINSGKEANYIVGKLHNIDDARCNLSKIEDITKKNDVDKNLLDNYLIIKNASIKIDRELSVVNNIIDSLKEIPSIDLINIDINNKLKELNEITLIKQNINELQVELNNNKIEDDKCIDIINKGIKEYKTKLSETGKCPVCNGNITQIVIDSVIEELKK